jgi:glycosyltransferase involved in cell wall biosynthesis
MAEMPHRQNKQNKKVAIVSNAFPPHTVGGIGTAHYTLYRELQRRSYPVQVFTFGEHGMARIAGEDDISRYHAPRPLLIALHLANLGMFSLLDRGKIAYQTLEILKGAVGSCHISRALQRFRPDVLILPDSGCPGCFIQRPPACHTLLIAHHNPVRFLGNPLLGAYSATDARLAIALEQRALQRVDTVICPSHYMKRVFAATYRFSGPVQVVPNGAEAAWLAALPAADIRQQHGLDSSTTLVYIPSAGSAIKGERFVGELVRRLATCTTEPIGFYLSGNIGAALAYELRFLPEHARLVLPGHLSYHENLAHIKACSFGISPTLLENLSMSLIEATLCGVPMVTFDVGGNREIITDGQNGLLAPYMDIEALLAAARRLLDSSERQRMCQTTRAYTASRFDTAVVMEQFLHVAGLV